MCLRLKFPDSKDEFKIISLEFNVSAKSVLYIKPPQIPELARGKFAVGQGKNRKNTDFEQHKLSGDPVISST